MTESQAEYGRPPAFCSAIAVREDLDLLTENETATAVNVEVRTLSTWRSRREGPSFVRLGRQIFYRRSDLLDWIDACTVDTGLTAPPMTGRRRKIAV